MLFNTFPSLIIEAEVSSQEDSMASMQMLIFGVIGFFGKHKDSLLLGKAHSFVKNELSNQLQVH
jgi:hypothetical protein